MRLSAAELDAVIGAVNHTLAGDAVEFFNGGVEVPEEAPHTREQKAAIRRADALSSALGKLCDLSNAKERAKVRRAARTGDKG